MYGEDYKATSDFKFIIAEKFRNKEENFICSVNRGDIINIRSEYEEGDIDVFSGAYASFPFGNYSNPGEEKKKLDKKFYFLHTATLTFLFKEMSFPNVLNND